MLLKRWDCWGERASNDRFKKAPSCKHLCINWFRQGSSWTLKPLGEKLIENKMFTSAWNYHLTVYSRVTKQKGLWQKRNLAGTVLNKWSALAPPYVSCWHYKPHSVRQWEVYVECHLCGDEPKVFNLSQFMWKCSPTWAILQERLPNPCKTSKWCEMKRK